MTFTTELSSLSKALINARKAQGTVPSCVKCGSTNCRASPNTQRMGLIAGGIIGAAGAVGGLRSTEITPGALIGVLAGLFWGACAGHAIGGEIGTTVVRKVTCQSCGYETSY